MDLQTVILSEVNQTESNTIWYHLHVHSKNGTKELISRTEVVTDVKNTEQIYGYQGKVEG